MFGNNKENMEDLLCGSGDATVPLKSAITLADLQNKNGFEFAIDEDSVLMDAAAGDDDDSYFKGFQSVILDQNDDSDTEYGEDLTFFQRCCLNMVDVTPDGGVKKKVKRPGVGNVAGEKGRIRAHYSAFLDGVDETFDSSRTRNVPLNVTLGKGQLIPGLDIALSTMKKNEISRFLMKPHYCYGRLGCPPRIPANATILYEIEMLSIQQESALGDYEDLHEGERERLPFLKIKKIATELNREGNELYTQDSHVAAIRKYVRAVKVVENARYKDEEQEKQIESVLLKSYHNMAQCYLKIGRFGKAIWCSQKVIDRKPEHVKALYICGKSMRHCGEFTKARRYLMKAFNLSPSSKDISAEIKVLGKKEQECKAAEELMCEKMFNFKVK